MSKGDVTLGTNVFQSLGTENGNRGCDSTVDCNLLRKEDYICSVMPTHLPRHYLPEARDRLTPRWTPVKETHTGLKFHHPVVTPDWPDPMNII